MQTLPRRNLDGRADQPPPGPAPRIVSAGRRGGYAARLLVYVALAQALAALSIALEPRGHFLFAACVLCALALLLALVGPARALRWPLAAALASLLLLAFGASQRAAVTLELRDGNLTVGQDGQQITAADVGHFRAIWLRQDAYSTSRGAPLNEHLPLLPSGDASLDWAVNGTLLSGVTAISGSGAARTALAPDAVIWQPQYRAGQPLLVGQPAPPERHPGPEGTYLRAATLDDGDFTLTLQLLRPTTSVRLLLEGAGGDDVEVEIHPEHSALTVYRVVPPAKLVHLEGGPLLARLSPLQSAQQLARQLGRLGVTTSALVVLCLLLARLVSRALPVGRRTDEPRQGGLDVALIIAVGASAAAVLVSRTVLDSMPHVQDSVAYLFQAKAFALGRITAPLPPAAPAFAHEFILQRDGLWFSKYPPGHPLVLALGVLAGVPWLVSPLAAGLSLVLAFLLARQVFGTFVAILALVLLASAPWFLVMSGTMMSHPTGLLFALLFLWLLERAERRGSWPAALGAGLALGMFGATRALTAVAFAAPFLLWVAWRLARERRIAPRHLALAAGAAVPLAGLLAYNATLTGHPLTEPFELWWAFDRVGFGPGVGMHGGHYPAWGLVNTWVNLAELQRWLFFWPIQLTLTLAAIPVLTGSRRTWDWLLTAACASVVVAYVFYWADGVMFGPRYYYEIIALLAILSARGVVRVGELAAAVFGPPDRVGGVAQALALVATLALVGWIATQDTPGFIRSLHGYNAMDDNAVQLARQLGVHHALVLVEHSDTTWEAYGRVFWANDPLLQGDVIYARDLGPESNRALLAAFPQRTVYMLDGQALRAVPRAQLLAAGAQ